MHSRTCKLFECDTPIRFIDPIIVRVTNIGLTNASTLRSILNFAHWKNKENKNHTHNHPSKSAAKFCLKIFSQVTQCKV